MIAHELAHYQQSDVKTCLLDMACIVINVTCVALSLISSPLYFCALVISEFVLFHFRQAWSRETEKEADLMAIRVLGSSKGALDFFSTYFVDLGSSAVKSTIKHSVDEGERTELSKLLENKQELLKIGEFFEDWGHNGFLKFTHSHPSVIERRAYCLEEEKRIHSTRG